MADITYSLDGRYYTDPKVFEIEQNGVLAETWQFAGHAATIPNAGDYFTFQLAGEDLFCIRGRDGEIQCFYNVCQHRAHQLVQGDGNATDSFMVPRYNRNLKTITSMRLTIIEV